LICPISAPRCAKDWAGIRGPIPLIFDFVRSCKYEAEKHESE
jgi:hypothetical protein